MESLNQCHSARQYQGKPLRFKQLDLNLLVALDALLQERNISRAAEKGSLAPGSAISRSSVEPFAKSCT